MKRGHCMGTKRERKPRKNEDYEAALFRWRMFGPQGQIGMNTLEASDPAWQMFGETTEQQVA